mmetsp:Transcript_28090/g.47073  ORF Transcript_28090/g.47073 Transcript_28090/m.47073 type:complete len:518 (+) Transcript_28090:196-1749(+)|eukprot:CAMPEP_0198223606 /NCGR_PEP_ID=MMETSP1445-20131203/93259_1 /TAXON_ID=36898 /ORGANISM="Pyramimonas sp., Strain CCMP2087" /LENGTH=517 /DNA_ID=CAMNT_0043902495 /DNA_START=184 /DNA_END=1737 /DNA_ORIENTATION=+
MKLDKNTLKAVGTALINPRLKHFRHSWLLAVLIGTLTLTGVLGTTYILLDQCDEVCGLTPVAFVENGSRCKEVTKEFDFGDKVRGAWRKSGEYPGQFDPTEDTVVFGVHAISATFRKGFKGVNLTTADWFVPDSVDVAQQAIFRLHSPLDVNPWSRGSQKIHTYNNTLNRYADDEYCKFPEEVRVVHDPTEDVFFAEFYLRPPCANWFLSAAELTSYHSTYRWALVPKKDGYTLDDGSRVQVELHVGNDFTSCSESGVRGPISVPLSFFTSSDLASIIATGNTTRMAQWFLDQMRGGPLIAETVASWRTNKKSALLVSTNSWKHTLSSCIYRREEYEICVRYRSEDVKNMLWRNTRNDLWHAGLVCSPDSDMPLSTSALRRNSTEEMDDISNWHFIGEATTFGGVPESLGDELSLLRFVVGSAKFKEILHNLENADWTVYCCKDICPSVLEALGSAFGYATYFEIFITLFVLLIHVATFGQAARVDGAAVTLGMVREVALEEDEKFPPSTRIVPLRP